MSSFNSTLIYLYANMHYGAELPITLVGQVMLIMLLQPKLGPNVAMICSYHNMTHCMSTTSLFKTADLSCSSFDSYISHLC